MIWRKHVAKNTEETGRSMGVSSLIRPDVIWGQYVKPLMKQKLLETSVHSPKTSPFSPGSCTIATMSKTMLSLLTEWLLSVFYWMVSASPFIELFTGFELKLHTQLVPS